jgi:hypothetical protein
MLSHAIIATLLPLFLTNPVSAVDVTSNPDLIAKLITADSQLDRLALLPDDAKDWHFDFTVQRNYNFAPGGVVNMNAATFPAAKGNGMTCEQSPSDRRCSPQDLQPYL